MGAVFDPNAGRSTALDLRTLPGFVRSLSLKPTAMQRTILLNYSQIGTFRAIYDERSEIVRAFGLALIWDTLVNRGSKATILSSCDDTGTWVMTFMRQAIRSGPQQLVDICNFEGNSIQFGSDPGWNIKLLRTFDAKIVSKRGKYTRLALILKENTSNLGFVEAKDALLASMRLPKRREIHLW